MTKPAHSYISAFKHVALLASVLIALFALDRVGAAALRFAFTRSMVSPEMMLTQGRPDTVVIGTSTAKYSFRPDAWNGKLLNLAQDGQTVVFSIVYAAVLPTTDSLKHLVVVIDAGDLRIGMSNPNLSRVWRIAPALAGHPEISSLLKSPLPWHEPLGWSHLYRYRGTVEDIIKGLIRQKPASYEALAPGRVSPPGNNNSSKSTGTHRHLDPALDKIVALLKATTKRLRTTLVLVSPLAYKRPSPEEDRLVFSELAAKLQDIPFCNLLDVETPELRRIRDEAKYFHDEVHLDGRGAIAYTREMQRVIDDRCGQPQTASSAAR
jgi:hypothetical protein